MGAWKYVASSKSSSVIFTWVLAFLENDSLVSMRSNGYLYFADYHFFSFLSTVQFPLYHSYKQSRRNMQVLGCSAWSCLRADSQLSSGSQSLLAPEPYFWGWICSEVWLLCGISTIWCGAWMQITRSTCDGRVCCCCHGKWYELLVHRVWLGRTTPRSWNLGCRHHWQQ